MRNHKILQAILMKAKEENKLILSLEKKYCSKGISENKLIALGKEALKQCAEKLSPEKYKRFHAWWIQQAMLKAIKEKKKKEKSKQ